METNDVKQNELNRLAGGYVSIAVGGKTVRIKEPTLGVMDLMSREWLKLPDVAIGDKTSNIDAMKIAKANIVKHSRTIAKAIAIGIIGEGCFGLFGNMRVRRMARRVYKRLSHSECRRATEVLSGASGLMDFIISMKLMSAAETTAKNGIE